MNTDTSHLIIAQSSSWSKNDAKDSWILLIFSAFVFDLTDRFFCGWIFTVCYLVGGLDCGHGDHHLFKWQLLTCSWGFSGGYSGRGVSLRGGRLCVKAVNIWAQCRWEDFVLRGQWGVKPQTSVVLPATKVMSEACCSQFWSRFLKFCFHGVARGGGGTGKSNF